MMSNAVPQKPRFCQTHDLFFTEDRCWKCERAGAVAASATSARDFHETMGSIAETLENLGIDAGPTPEAASEAPAEAQVLDLPVAQRTPRGTPQEIARFLKTAKLDAPAAYDILEVCLDLAAFLMEKNAAYGNSALEPLRVVSKADAAEQIRVRIDDKLSRLFRGHAGGEDALKDLVGYWVLLKVAEMRADGDRRSQA